MAKLSKIAMFVGALMLAAPAVADDFVTKIEVKEGVDISDANEYLQWDVYGKDMYVECDDDTGDVPDGWYVYKSFGDDFKMYLCRIEWTGDYFSEISDALDSCDSVEDSANWDCEEVTEGKKWCAPNLQVLKAEGRVLGYAAEAAGCMQE